MAPSYTSDRRATPDLLIDGRVLTHHYPGVTGFWVPILTAWAQRGGRATVVHRRGHPPPAALVAAGMGAFECDRNPRNPLATVLDRRRWSTFGARVALSPLYLTLDGPAQRIATIFDLIGRTHARHALARFQWELAIRHTLRRATTIVTPTQTVAMELAATFPSAVGKITTISPVAVPVRPDLARLTTRGLDGPYALCVASHRPHKRLSALAHAWATAAPPCSLVLVGHGTELLDQPPWVRGLGYVTDAVVDTALARASCLVCASLAEGFGLPVLAAMASGVPVVSTRQAALEEVAGDAATWVAAERLDDLVNKAVAIVKAPHTVREQVARGINRAQQFSATRAAETLQRLLTAS